MSDAVQPGPVPAAEPAHVPVSAPGTAAAQAMAALQQAGADRLDPVRWHYLQTLSARMAQHEGRVQVLLQSRLEGVLAELQSRVLQSGGVAAQGPGALGRGTAPADTASQAPAPLRSPLAALTQYLTQHPQALESQPGRGMDAAVGVDAGMVGAGLPLRDELKAVRQFRNTWAKLSAGQQLNRALDQAPKNAGPINSHMLVLRSLALMRDISPDYLNRFMAYADALLCLDQPVKEQPVPGTPTEGTSTKKARSPRSKPRPPKIPE